MSTVAANQVRPSVGPMLELPTPLQVNCCRKCDRPVQHNNVVVEDCRPEGKCIVMTYCRACGHGFESVYLANHNSWTYDFSVGHKGPKARAVQKKIRQLRRNRRGVTS